MCSKVSLSISRISGPWLYRRSLIFNVSQQSVRELAVDGSSITGYRQNAKGCLKGLGERLLVTENQLGIEVFNGDIGVVIETHDNRNPRVRFAHLDQPLLRNQLGSVEPAWAISIHRSQGSEYNSVLICLPEPLSDRSRFRPTRELLYTAFNESKRPGTICHRADARAGDSKRNAPL